MVARSTLLGYTTFGNSVALYDVLAQQKITGNPIVIEGNPAYLPLIFVNVGQMVIYFKTIML